MFDIEYKGGNGVVIATKKVSAVFDPKLSLIGLKDIPVKDALEFATEERFKVESEDAKLIVESPGEYEIGEFSIRGIPATRHIDTDQIKAATVYRVEIGDVRIVVLGNIAAKLSDDQLEEIGIVDIVIIPIGGGGYTLDASSAAVIVRQISPKAVIPVHYADSAVHYEVPQDTLETFTGELSAPVEAAGSKYKIKTIASLPSVLTVVEITRS